MRRRLTMLSVIFACRAASAQHFLDLNSLQAFAPASTPDELALLSLNYHPLNTTLPLETSPNPSYAFSSSTNTIERQGQAPTLNKRQSACGSYKSCSALGAPSLCCKPAFVCSADTLGRVGCCPSGAACTGQIPGAGGVVATSYVASTSTVMAATTMAATTTAETTTTVTGGGGFVLAGSQTVAVLGSGAEGCLRPVSSGVKALSVT